MKYLVFIFMLVLTSCGGNPQNVRTTDTGKLATTTPTPKEIILPTVTTLPATSTPFSLDAEFRQLLETWAEKDEQILTIEDSADGQIVSIVPREGIEPQVMMRVEGDRVFFTDLYGREMSKSVDDITTENRGGFTKLFVAGEGTDEDPGHMWRYPWGGFVEDREKTYTQNGVSIITNDAECYGGLCTIKPENVEKTWEGFVTGVYNVNKISEHTEFLNQYPTLDSFLQAAKEGVVFDNIRILARHPNRQDFDGIYGATWEEVDGINLSQIVMSGVSLLSEKVIQDFRPAGFGGIIYSGIAGGTTSMSVLLREGNSVLSWSFARRSLHDYINNSVSIGPGVILGLSPYDESNKIMRSLTQLVTSYLHETQLLGEGQLDNGFWLYRLDFDGGPLIKLVVDFPANQQGNAEWINLQDLENSPFQILE